MVAHGCHQGRQPPDGERQAEDGGVLDDSTLIGRQAVQPACDERVQARREGQIGEVDPVRRVGRENVAPFLGYDGVPVDQSAHRFDGVQRDALRALHQGVPQVGRQPADQTVHECRHLHVR